MHLLSFAGVSLYAVLLATSVTGAPTNEGTITKDRLPDMPLEVIYHCMSYMTWRARFKARLANKTTYQFFSEDENLSNMDIPALIKKYANDGNPGNAQTVVDLMCDIHEEDVQEDLGPYWTRSLSMRSPLLADNHVLLSTLDPKVLQEQTPFLSMLVDTQSFYKFDANLPALINLMVHLAAPPSASVLPGAALGYWIWKDILKVAVLYNNVKVVEITLKHMPDVYKAWYSNTYYAYYDQFNSNDDLEWPLESMKDDDDRKNDLIKDMLEEGHVAVTNASTSFYMWQRALFWTWAIALGHNEVRDVLEPKGEEWTTDHYKRLTTIMCQKQVAKVCDYLTHVKGYNYIPDDNINFDQMPFAQKLRELPNPYLNWDISDPQKVWVAAPEESVPMPQ